MYHQFIFLPLYNGLVGLVDLFPWIDVGIAVALFTVVVRLVIFPLSKQALITQVKMKEVEPEANKIKIDYAKDKQAQGLKVMGLYKSKGIHPFSGVILLIIQLPILLALISVFYKIIPTIDQSLLYPFILAHLPATLHTNLLGFIDLTKPSLILSLITAAIQFFQMHYSLASRMQRSAPKSSTPNLANSMNTQMKYVLPLIAFASTYWIIPVKFPQAASTIAIYWSVSSLFTLGQELYIRKKHLNKESLKAI